MDKSHGFSPDAFVPMAFQAVCCDLYGEYLTLESWISES